MTGPGQVNGGRDPGLGVDPTVNGDRGDSAPDDDALRSWLLCLRDPLMTVEQRLSAQAGVLRSLRESPDATTAVLAAVLVVMGQALREASEVTGWDPLVTADGAPALDGLSVRVGDAVVAPDGVPADPAVAADAVAVLSAPERIRRVHPVPLDDAGWAVVALCASGSARLVMNGAAAPAGSPGVALLLGAVGRVSAAHPSLAVWAAVASAARWMLAATDVLAPEWTPGERRLMVALDLAYPGIEIQVDLDG